MRKVRVSLQWGWVKNVVKDQEHPNVYFYPNSFQIIPKSLTINPNLLVKASWNFWKWKYVDVGGGSISTSQGSVYFLVWMKNGSVEL